MKSIYLVFREWGSDHEFCCACEDELDAEQFVLDKERQWREKTKEANEYPWYVSEVKLKQRDS